MPHAEELEQGMFEEHVDWVAVCLAGSLCNIPFCSGSGNLSPACSNPWLATHTGHSLTPPLARLYSMGYNITGLWLTSTLTRQGLNSALFHFRFRSHHPNRSQSIITRHFLPSFTASHTFCMYCNCGLFLLLTDYLFDWNSKSQSCGRVSGRKTNEWVLYLTDDRH